MPEVAKLIGLKTANEPLALPPDLQNSIRITWNISHWCNYQCDYCGVMVYSRRTNEKQEHAFDHYSADQWLVAFLRIKSERTVLKILGGEPFMDRANWKQLLCGLIPEGRFEFDIFTNGAWNPDYYRDLPSPEKVHLTVSFHSGQTKFAPWRERLLRIRDAGFSINSVVTVLAPENMEQAELFRSTMKADGIFPELRQMIPAGIYHFRKRVPPGAANGFTPALGYMHALGYRTKGLPCFFPAVSYDLEYDGRVKVSCVGDNWSNFITDPFPQAVKSSISCPLDTCTGCMEMAYSMPGNPFVPQPMKLATRVSYVEELIEVAARTEELPAYFENTMRGALMPDGSTDCYEAFVDQYRETPPPAVDIAVDGIFQALPDTPVTGYLDEFDTVREAKASERIQVSGWAFSRSPAGPVKQVRIEMDGRTLAVFDDFGPRPSLPAIFGRKEMAQVGFGGLVFLPRVRPGDYELAAIATDHDGNEHEKA